MKLNKMRKRKEIEAEVENSGKVDRVILEVLLDIRDLLAK
jgi:hypothetical protein